MEMSSDLVEAKIELMVNMATKKLQDEIKLLNQKIYQLTNEISTLKQPRIEPIIEEKKPDIKIEQTQLNTAPEVQKTEEADKPRTGDYQPGDINLEEFFYCGNKKF